MEADRTPDKPLLNLRHLQNPYVDDKETTNSCDLAKRYVADKRTDYGIGRFELALDKSPSDKITDDGTEIRFSKVKSIRQTDTVTFVQTHFGLPIWEAGISVSVQKDPLRVTNSQSSIHRTVNIQRPAPGAEYLTKEITPDVLADLLKIPSARLMDTSEEDEEPPIMSSKLFIFRYDRPHRSAESTGDTTTVDSALNANPPTLPLDDEADKIHNGMHYVVREILFTTKPEDSHSVNWRAFLEVETGTILYLRSLASAFMGSVFPIDPATATGNTTITPASSNAILEECTAPVELLGIEESDPQVLRGDKIVLVDLVLPHPRVTEPSAPGEFIFGPKTKPNDFSAVSAYYHCDDAFRMVKSMGFDLDQYFEGSTFPVMVDPQAKVPSKSDSCEYGDCVNAATIATRSGDGVKCFLFSRINENQALSIATDKRAVLHEFGHALLLNSIGSPTLGFAHSVGDSLAVIHCDPESKLDDRFMSFPWIEHALGSAVRRHDRAVTDGWGWGGTKDDHGYKSEQILSTTLFRAYLAAGGCARHDDSTVRIARRRYAARHLIYLIVHAIGSLPSSSTTPTLTPGIFATHLMHADIAKPDFEGHPSGAFHKVISWAFEKQGLVDENGSKNSDGEGIPPVDVYIDDGRNGEYEYQESFWNATHIWNRRDDDAGVIHETPILNQTNYVYVRVKNRGAQAATGVEVSAYHTDSSAGLVWSDGWHRMTPDLKTADNPIEPGSSEVLGAFEWTPTTANESLLATVTAPGDRSNIDPTLDYAHRNGQTALWQLVPFDNNIALRNVVPVPGGGGADSLVDAIHGQTFRVSNPCADEAQVQIESTLPSFLTTRDWQLRLSDADRAFTLQPDEHHNVTVELQPGQAFSADDVRESGLKSVIELRALIDHQIVGGMTYMIDPDMMEAESD